MFRGDWLIAFAHPLRYRGFPYKAILRRMFHLGIGSLHSPIPCTPVGPLKAIESWGKPLFFHIQNFPQASLEIFEYEKSGQLMLTTFYCFAESGGFEPPVRLPVRQFSKLLVSATHPSFPTPQRDKTCFVWNAFFRKRLQRYYKKCKYAPFLSKNTFFS